MPDAIRVDVAACNRYARGRSLLDAIRDEGMLDQIVDEMRRLAPENTGKGADSIDYELDESGEFWRISWGKAHFYMYFSEVGTDDEPARPFMRPVADRFNTR